MTDTETRDALLARIVHLEQSSLIDGRALAQLHQENTAVRAELARVTAAARELVDAVHHKTEITHYLTNVANAAAALEQALQKET